MSYQAPLADMQFVLEEIAGLQALAGLPGLEEATPDLVEAVLQEAGRLAGEVLAPINHSGDRQGVSLENGVVRTAEGFAKAYGLFADGGWTGLTVPAAWGGQELPHAVGTAASEMWNAANLSFALCPLLSAGAMDVLLEHGSDEQKRTYLPHMVSGRWTGTMNLTEPQAGSDVGAVKTRAVPDGDHYRITGQKIYITYGEHDLAENIVHMVLARTPDAPAGTKGISLFIVPKYLPNDDGAPGERNDLRCVSVEHKLGIHASPTCVMSYGDDGGAKGFLIGDENRGMEYMFTMMNAARIAVGVQGLAIAERAYQQAVNYAKERRQGRKMGAADALSAPIVEHADIRRTLATMSALTQAGRGLAYTVGAAVDRNRRRKDPTAKALEEVLTPVVKAWLTDMGCQVASMGVQVHGGMGFIEETGAAQHYRDARILPIYEGTNGIQALDLVMRKVLRDEGKALGEVERWLDGLIRCCEGSSDDAVADLAEPLTDALNRMHQAGQWLMVTARTDLERAAAAATPFLSQMGAAIGGVLLGAMAAAAAQRLEERRGDEAFNRRKIKTAQFYAHNVLPYAEAEAQRVLRGAVSAQAFEAADF